MKRLLTGIAFASLLVLAHPREAAAQAQVVGGVGQVGACPTSGTQVNPVYGAPVLINSLGQLCTSAVISGSVTASPASNGATGSAVPASADYQGLNNGGNMIGEVGDSSGRPIVVGAGGAGTPAGGVLSVQGVTSGTALPVSEAAPSTVAPCAALCSNLVVSASAGILHTFNVSADSTLSGAAWWIMVFNATSLPSDGAVTPNKCYAMPSGATGLNASWPEGVSFSTGIVIGVSTTGCFTKTASVHAFIGAD